MRWSCKIDANAAIGIIGRQGGWDKEVVLRKVQSGDNIADIGAKVLERDTIQEQWKTWDVSDWSGRVRGLLADLVCARTPPHPHQR